MHYVNMGARNDKDRDVSCPGTGRKPLAEMEKATDVPFQRLCFKYLTTQCLSHLLSIDHSTWLK